MDTHDRDTSSEGGTLVQDLHESWRLLAVEERLEGFRLLPRADAEDFFFELTARDQSELILLFERAERRSWLRLLAPDDAADVVQESPEDDRSDLLDLLDLPSRREVAALLAYAEDDAGGLMNPRYARLRPDMSLDEAVTYLRKQAREQLDTIYYIYVVEADQHLLGVVSLRQMFSSQGTLRVRDIMETDVVTALEDMDQEVLSNLLAKHDLIAIPVVDVGGRMKGIVTVDDIVDVVREEATEDIQKIGGSEALDAPYLDVGFLVMARKRGVWLLVLFVGEMLTTYAMGRYEHEIASAVILAMFVPLIISSGGNSGSQASTLVIRAMALGEVRLSDWWRVVRREALSGLSLGLLLGSIGFIRIAAGEKIFGTFGEHYALIGFTVWGSLVGVVTFGTLAGSMLPFILRRFGFDPASASAPFVATLVDVTGIVIYFSLAKWLLTGALL